MTSTQQKEPADPSWLDPLSGITEDPALQALILLAVSVVAAYLLSFFLGTVLKRLAGKTKTNLDDQLVSLLHGPVVKTVVLLGASWSLSRLELTADSLIAWRRVLATVGLMVWVAFLPKLFTLLLEAAGRRKDKFRVVGQTTLPLFRNLTKLLVFGLAVWLFISIWGVDATGILASAGIVGLAVGFAAQDTLANVFSGIFIIADSPYKVGDFVVLDSAERGQVSHIGLRSTRLLTRDDIEISIPNAVMGQAKITNESGGPHLRRRLRIPVGVAYDSDLEAVRKVVLSCVAGVSLIAPDPNPRVRYRRFGESSVDLELLCWIPNPELKGQAVDALVVAIHEAFRKEGIQIPFPQRDLHLHQTQSLEKG